MKSILRCCGKRTCATTAIAHEVEIFGIACEIPDNKLLRLVGYRGHGCCSIGIIATLVAIFQIIFDNLIKQHTGGHGGVGGSAKDDGFVLNAAYKGQTKAKEKEYVFEIHSFGILLLAQRLFKNIGLIGLDIFLKEESEIGPSPPRLSATPPEMR